MFEKKFENPGHGESFDDSTNRFGKRTDMGFQVRIRHVKGRLPRQDAVVLPEV